MHTLTPNPALDMRMRFINPHLGELNRAESVILEPSGKGLNVARALAQLGQPARAILPLGGLFAPIFDTVVEQVKLVKVPIGGATRCNVKVIDQEGNLTEFNAPGPTLGAEEWEKVEEALLNDVTPGDAVVLSGSLPRGVSVQRYLRLMERLRTKEARVCLDAEGESLRLGLQAQPFLVKPNRKEAQELLGQPIDTIKRAAEAARTIKTLGPELVVLSLGAKGAIFLGEGCIYAIPPSIRPNTTTGCGDSLLAGTLAGLAQNLPWPEIARHATALAVARALAQRPIFPTPEDVKAVAGDIRIEML